MYYRTARIDDIPAMQLVRNAVKENPLSDPSLIKDDDYIPYLITKGKGWVCEIDQSIVGFSIIDLNEHNVWAFFVHPDFEKRGIGIALHDAMLNWYFNQTHELVWLSTSPNTRAANFYKKAGWVECGFFGKSEIKFEMSYLRWRNR